MFVDYRGSVLGLLRWQWKSIALFVFASTLVVIGDVFGAIEHLKLQPLPIVVAGGTLGIFVSFRTNSAYDRWWEGRKLWGSLVNVSRHFTSQVLGYVGRRDDSGRELARRMIRRHIGYVHVLRCLLRSEDPLRDVDVKAFVDEDERKSLAYESNMTHALVHRQLDELIALADAGHLEERRLQVLDQSLRVMLDVQGGCERILKTPMPRGYAYIAEKLVWLFGFLLPLGLVDQLSWFTIPISAVVCLSFALISEVGRVLEDPFTMFWPSLPLNALAKTIEINLRQRLGEQDLPALPVPVDGILM